MFDWPSVLATWDRWQTFNAAMIALLASVIGLKITQIKDEETSKRKYLARKALLPHAFAKLTAFFSEAEDYYIDLFLAYNESPQQQSNLANYSGTIPTGYDETILNVMEHASDERVRIFLSQIMGWMQIDISRLKSNQELLSTFPFFMLKDVLALHYYVNNNFEWARESNKPHPTLNPPTIDDLFTLLMQSGPNRGDKISNTCFESDFRNEKISRDFLA